jgi:hypothetical protein
MPITGIYTKDFPDLGRDAGATDLIPIAEVGNIVTKKTPVSGLITNARVVGALGFTPYDASNPAGYISGITSGMVTTALGFNPYNATNPAGYITSASLEPLEFNTFDRTVWNNGGGNIDTNTSFGDEALKSNTTGTSSTAIGRAALSTNITGVANTALGWSAGSTTPTGAANSNGSSSIFIGAASKPLGNTQTNQIAIGVNAVGLGSNTTVLGNVNTSFGRWWGNLLIGDSSNTGQPLQVTGNMKLTGTLTNGTFTYTLPSATGTLALTSALTGYVTLDTSQTITGAKFFTGFLTGLRASFESSGSSNTFAINHTSGSGIALNILKDGNGEALTIVKGSGSGNAASITGGITLLSELNLTTKLADVHINSAATWNAKIGGSGTTNYLAKFTASGVVGNSAVFESGGNVGIGTTTPTGRLTLSREPGIATITGVSDLVLDGSSTSGILFLNTYSTGNTIICNGGGNVGIGTTSPGTKLHVLANSAVDEGNAAAIIRQGGGNNNNGLLVDVTNSVNTYIADFRQGNSSLMRLAGNGNLLIGTTTDAGFKLDVNGSLRANTRVNFASLPTSATGLVSGDLWRNGTVINIVA